MADEATAPAEQVATETQTTETVRDPQAVLKQNEELLSELKRLKPLAKKAEGFDFDKAQAAIEAQAKAEEDRLTKRGEYDKLLEQKQKAFEDRLAQEAAEREKIQADLKAERWDNLLAQNGIELKRLQVLKDLQSLGDRTEMVPDANGRLILRLKDGVGDAGELGEAISRITKGDGAFLLPPSTASGSGANGSQQNGGSSTPKTATRAQLDAMSPADKKAFYLADGEVSE